MKYGRTVATVLYELTNTPFLPLLFIAEAVKVAVTGDPHLLEFTALSVASTFVWAAVDKIDLQVGLNDDARVFKDDSND